MGTRGLCNGAGAHGSAFGSRRWDRFAYIVSSFVLLPALFGCSSLSPGPNQPTAVSSPPAAAAPTDEQATVSPYPRQSLVDVFTEDTNTPPPPRPPSAAGTQLTTASPETDSLPYPKQSLVSLFQGSTSSTPNANVPHPPSTYTPSGQPYTPPPGQQTYNPPAAAAPPAASAQAPAAAQPSASSDAAGGPYPKQSLFDLFSNKSSQ
jgi:hypothetical protein